MFAAQITEFYTVVFLSGVSNPLDVIIKFLVLANIAKIDKFYYWSLPNETGDKQHYKIGNEEIKITNHRRKFEHQDSRPTYCKYLRIVYKIYRIANCSWVFYFLPLNTLIWPYICQAGQSFGGGSLLGI
jgi:hypothetical protein